MHIETGVRSNLLEGDGGIRMGGENDRTKLFDSELKVMNVLWKEGLIEALQHK